MSDSAGPSAVVIEDLLTIAGADLPLERLAGKTVAVTGAAGFLGSYVVRVLLALHRLGRVTSPVKVIAIVRDQARAEWRLPDLRVSEHLTWVSCDLAVPDNLDVSADWFIHAASPASPKFYGVDPLGTIGPNVRGTWKLLELAERATAEGFLFVSSSEVYGAVPGSGAITERQFGHLDPTSVRSSYAESKRLGETLCVSYLEQRRAFPVFIVRPFHTYGPGLALDDGRVFMDFVADVLARRNIRLNSDGSASRAFCYVTDAVRGFFTVLLTGKAGVAYNVANPDGSLTIAALAQLLTEMYGELGIGVERRTPTSSATYLPSPNLHVIPDVARLNGLGWRQQVLPEEGFRRLITSFESLAT